MNRGTFASAGIALFALAAPLACGPPPSAEVLACNDDSDCRSDQRCEGGICVYAGRRAPPVDVDAGPTDPNGLPTGDAGPSFSSSPGEDAGSSDATDADAGEADAGAPDAGPPAVCGDGEVDDDEDCDDGNTLDDGNGCSADCLANAECGNGVVESLYESCDTALHPCCAEGCEAPAPSDTVCRAADGSCDVEERCDGTALECPADELLADDAACDTCDFGNCACELGVCEARRMTLAPADLSFFGTDSYFPAASADGCHEHGNADRDQQVGTWESAEEERTAVEFALPDVAIAEARLRFEVESFDGYDNQTGPGDFEVEIYLYEGNGAVGTGDCFRSTRARVASFMTTDLQLHDDLSFDVTEAVSAALADQLEHVGFRLQPATDPGPNTAIVLDDFDLVLEPE